MSNDRGSQLCFPLCVFSCCCLSSMAPPHMLEHMRTPAWDARTGPDMGAKAGAPHTSSSLLPSHGDAGEMAPARASRGKLGFISPCVGEVLCKATMEDLRTGKRNYPSGWNKHSFTNRENSSEVECQCTACWWKSGLKNKSDIWTNVMYLKG